MNEKSVILSKDGHVGLLTLNRPEKLNAIDQSMRVELSQALQAAQDDNGTRVLIITGAGKGFCSGADLSQRKAAHAGQEPGRQEKLRLVGEFILAFENINKPVIAAVNGVAAGVGLSLALACDLRIASTLARFSAIWTKRGLIPDGGATLLLPSIVGLEKALELTLTADVLDAAEAERIKLVSRVVSAENLLEETMRLARHIASLPPIAIELTKRVMLQKAREQTKAQLLFETYAQNLCRETNDHREAVKAFLEKRDAIFTGT
ncbi:enoyl-CoA hydratase/isomerase family protein [Alcaligenaceae bacterium]|nr:enoyl-CoA hydratase/isomerase family protein [Alcaligenaceae bacterium]